MAPHQQVSAFEQFTNAPVFTVATHIGLFVAGVAFINSSLMDMLVPQL